jgi:hypothetical protein
MKSLSLLIGAALLLADFAARAADVRIYAGSMKEEYFDSNANSPTVFGLYVVFDNTTSQFAFITYNRKTPAVGAGVTIVNETFTQNYPYNPFSAKTRAFVSADTSSGGAPINYFRFRSTGAPTITPYSSAAAGLVAHSFSYLRHYWAPATFYVEDSGTVTYQKALTIQSNDGGLDLTGAKDLVIQHLKDLKYIN